MTPAQRTDLLALCAAIDTFVATVRQYLATYPEVPLPPPRPGDDGVAQRCLLDRLWNLLPAAERRRWLIEGLTPSERRTAVEELGDEEEHP